MENLPSLQQAVGRPLAIVHLYVGWSEPAPIKDLTAITANGSIPLLDWGCGISDASVAAGNADTLITTYAQALKSFGKPMFLRWYWEMNILQTRPQCKSAGGSEDYVAAWQRIWTIFHEVGASNVSFVWSPGVTGVDPTPYYPGDQYVDWIGVDGYDSFRQGTAAFREIFFPFYQIWSSHSKPMMVAESGAIPSNQAEFLEGAEQTLPNLAAFKAFVYFDAVGKVGDWVLSSAGLAAFHAMAHNQYFSPRA